MALGSYGSVTVTTTATKIIGANILRRGIVIANTDPTLTMYIGTDNLVTSGNGFPVYPKGSFSTSNDFEIYRGDIFGISVSGSIDARQWEWI